MLTSQTRNPWHGLDRKLGADEGLLPERHVLEHRAPHETQPGRDVTKRRSKQEAQERCRIREDAGARADLVAERDDQVVMVLSWQREVLDLVLSSRRS
jgi:hypothetical protein